MSIFPTRIPLATDGSGEAELATLRALDIAERTDSELHVVHVGVVPRLMAQREAVEERIWWLVL